MNPQLTGLGNSLFQPSFGKKPLLTKPEGDKQSTSDFTKALMQDLTRAKNRNILTDLNSSQRIASNNRPDRSSIKPKVPENNSGPTIKDPRELKKQLKTDSPSQQDKIENDRYQTSNKYQKNQKNQKNQTNQMEPDERVSHQKPQSNNEISAKPDTHKNEKETSSQEKEESTYETDMPLNLLLSAHEQQQEQDAKGNPSTEIPPLTSNETDEITENTVIFDHLISSEPINEKIGEKSDSSPNLRDINPEIIAFTGMVIDQVNQGIIDIPEAISLMTGAIEKIDPKNIAKVVTENPFIQSAIQTEDVHGFLHKPMPMGDILRSLNFNKDTIQMAREFGINLAEPVAPVEFLRSLGSDIQSVTSELAMLRQSIPLDGVQPLIERSVRIRENIGETQPTNIAPAVTAPLVQGHVPGGIPGEPFFLDQADSQIHLNNISEQLNTRSRIDDPTLLVNSTIQKHGLENSPVTMSSIDPYEDMSKLMTNSSKVSSFQQIHSIPSDNIENLVKMNIDNHGIMQNPDTNNQEKTNTLNTLFETSKPNMEQSNNILKQSPIMIGQNNIQNKAILNSQNTETEMLLTDSKVQGKIDILKSDTQSNSSTDSHSFQDNQFSGFYPEAKEIKVKGNKFESTLNTPVKESVFNKVYDNASMLVKNGGGSMKINLQTEDLGHIDLAVNLDQNKIDIKILASSEKARELIMQDLSKLRDSLSTVNVNLKDVEVDIRGNNSWSHNFDDGHQESGQSSYQEKNWQNENEIGQETITTKQSIITRVPQPSQLRQGSISVRI